MEKIILVAGLSFVTALSGAMQPGPLLTYTIMQTLKTPKRGWLTGARVIAGHAALELVLVIAILLGLSAILQNDLFIKVMGIGGSIFLLFIAFLTLRDVFIKRVALPGLNAGAGHTSTMEKNNNSTGAYIGGVLVSMSNPFWWIWWATLGFFFMREYDVSLSNIPLFASFFLGHEAGDLGWYSLISVSVHTGRRWLDQKRYHVLLVATAIVMAGFAGFLLYSTLNYRG